MMVFAIGVERAHDMAVQRPHNADACEHSRPAIFRREDQHLDRDLPALGVLVSLEAW
jgi:hypothetical protein